MMAPIEEGQDVSMEPDITVYRPDRPGIRKVLGDLEAEIMEFVWAHASGERSAAARP